MIGTPPIGAVTLAGLGSPRDPDQAQAWHLGPFPLVWHSPQLPAVQAALIPGHHWYYFWLGPLHQPFHLRSTLWPLPTGGHPLFWPRLWLSQGLGLASGLWEWRLGGGSTHFLLEQAGRTVPHALEDGIDWPHQSAQDAVSAEGVGCSFCGSSVLTFQTLPHPLLIT